jgi:5-methyltetrahydropteroyltriglutamate--homocysteine methyltransferase
LRADRTDVLNKGEARHTLSRAVAFHQLGRICSSGTGDLQAIGRIVTDKKVVIGVIEHHTLQIERPDQVADIVREALKHTPPERIMISSDCGMGREGMSRRHAQYKMVAMVLGTNIVRKEMGLPEAECLAADRRYSPAL